ncbi:DUF72 domain-containing protein [Myxococcota bacterium]|nr:DUF72 domain-containing protein [Myxococcota bacterium]MBU1533746.1 DUF72 domain-containing protein [Myxococcota bacterium]
MKIHIGVDNFPLHLAYIRRSCDAAEIATFANSLPRRKTLNQWHEDAPRGFRHIINVPRALTDPAWRKDKPSSYREGAQGFVPSAEREFIWEQLDKAAGVLRVNTFLFQTGITFRPTLQNMQNFKEFITSRKRKNYRFVWEPSGLWGTAEAIDFAAPLDLHVAQDPLAEEFEPTEEAFRYFRVKNLRSGTGISQMGFEEIYEASVGADRVFVVFCTPKPLTDARKFRAFLSEIQ